MKLSWVDTTTFLLFLVFVVTISIYASRKEKDSTDYFLAGKNLTWWAIGLSLIASNISTEHFIGMAGRGYAIGLAIASYEWMAAVTLVIVAIFFLPKFIKTGIFTMPQFLEHRYGRVPRTIMAIFILLAYIFVALASILYSGALALQSIFSFDLVYGIWAIGIVAGVYTVYGGLKAVVWSDIIQGVTLILGGLLVTYMGFREIGGVERFFELSQDQLHTVLPWNHPEMPWVAVFVGGLWIPNLFYWGFNQFIGQRVLAAKSIAEGQKGILFAAFLKLLIPFIIIFPGIMALHLYGDKIGNPDQSYTYMINQLLPIGFRGIILAALFGAVMSSLDSVLNSSATIFTIDLYQPFINPKASEKKLVFVGKSSTAILVIAGCLWAPTITNFGSVFKYMQMIWGFISPAIVASFLFGFMSKRTPSFAASGAMILGVPLYGALLWLFPKMAFLHHMAITFLCLSIFMGIVRIMKPLGSPMIWPELPNIDVRPYKRVKQLGAVGVLSVATLYYFFF